MYPIEQDDLPEEFFKAWQIAGSHLQKMGQGSVNWIRANLNKPFVEHLSFRVGNQLFFVFIEIDAVPFESRKDFFLNVCEEATAIPCLFTMERSFDSFEPNVGSWGLINVITGKPVNPLDLVSDELIPMSDWEVHDLGIQIVKNHIEDHGNELLSSQSSLHIDPNIWFKDKKTGKNHWVVVRSARYPKKNADQPSNINNIKSQFERTGDSGYFASVVVANANDPFDPFAESTGNFLPVYRGHQLNVKFEGLQDI